MKRKRDRESSSSPLSDSENEEKIDLNPRKLLGRGSFGKVFSLKNQEYVMKISQLFSKKNVIHKSKINGNNAKTYGLDIDKAKANGLEKAKANGLGKTKTSNNLNENEKTLNIDDIDHIKLKETYDREVYFLRLLHPQGITPLLQNTYIDDEKQAVQIMERYDGSLKDLFLEQAKIMKLPKHACLIKEKQFRTINHLVKQLDNQGIIHGDLKISNFLYKSNGDIIKIADFGFAGSYSNNKILYQPLIGFSRHYGHSAKKVQDKQTGRFILLIPIHQELRNICNRAQLLMYFVNTSPIFYQSIDGKIKECTIIDLLQLLHLTAQEFQIIKKYAPKLSLPKKILA